MYSLVHIGTYSISRLKHMASIGNGPAKAFTEYDSEAMRECETARRRDDEDSTEDKQA